jgi:Fur family ferric uptake transcriptional regulator
MLGALRESGQRLTAARRAICAVLAASPGAHLSASEIYDRAAARTPDLNQSTVYRTIDALEELGFLHHVHFGHGPGVYHLSPEVEHYHLVCEVCGTTAQVDRDDFDTALTGLARKAGFSSIGLHFALEGVCSRCAAGADKVRD